jgi:ubiquinone/menaquinone biosynthesis C-methylase UbiE
MKDNNKIVKDFGLEWEKFNQIDLKNTESQNIFEDYFDLIEWKNLNLKGHAIDLGCGTGRWARLVAPKFKQMSLLDGSDKSINVAKKMLSNHKNIKFVHADLKNIPSEDNAYDFAYSLGVLHHVPNVNKALKEINRILKPGSPFLVYLYYSFDNAPYWYRLIWNASNLFRKMICKLPKNFKMIICEIIALLVYLPLARTSFLLEKMKVDISYMPLSYYRNKSFYTMRTDSLDRFGTTYEKRYSRMEIEQLLLSQGFNSVKFSDKKPYWCAIAYKNKVS